MAAFLFFILCILSPIQVKGTNAWFKPIKFSLSTGLFCWSMAWYMLYLKAPLAISYYSFGVSFLLGLEILYIAIQAGRGQMSHFNISSSFYSLMYSLMGIAATAVTLWTLYIGILFFTDKSIELPPYYLWSIRSGIFIFVLFALEGFVMGGKLSHSVGGSDGGLGLPFLNWSIFHGDPRVAHFTGMHALQVIPLLSFYVFRSRFATTALVFLYTLLAILTLLQALNGKPLVKKSIDLNKDSNFIKS